MCRVCHVALGHPDDRLRCQRKGRSRRAGTGRDHQRPLKRHAVLRLGAVSMAIAGFGQSASTPAMIATTSASVGVGVTLLTDTAVL